jgi:hypothetical protein
MLATAAPVFRLPCEVIRQIIELGVDEELVEWDTRLYRRDLQSVASTCRTFRDVALSSSKVWALLSDDMWWEELDTYIQRSKKSLLSIRVRPGEYGEQQTSLDRHGRMTTVEFLEKVVPLSHRWKTIRITFEAIGRFSGTHSVLMKGLISRMADLELPLLSKLQIVHSNNEATLGRGRNDPYSELRVYSTWSTPWLRELILHNRIPSPVPIFGGHLARCQMCFNIDDWKGAQNHHHDPFYPLAKFLRSQPSLEKLSLQLHDTGRTKTFVTWEEPIVMGRLKSLHLDSMLRGVKNNPIPAIVNSIEAPQMQRLNINVRTDSSFATESFFQFDRTYPSLENVTISMRLHGDPRSVIRPVLFRKVLAAAPKLKLLTFDRMVCEFISEKGPREDLERELLPPLQFMNMHNCDSLTEEALARAMALICSRPYWGASFLSRISECIRSDRRNPSSWIGSEKLLAYSELDRVPRVCDLSVSRDAPYFLNQY